MAVLCRLPAALRISLGGRFPDSVLTPLLGAVEAGHDGVTPVAEQASDIALGGATEVVDNQAAAAGLTLGRQAYLTCSGCSLPQFVELVAGELEPGEVVTDLALRVVPSLGPVAELHSIKLSGTRFTVNRVPDILGP